MADYKQQAERMHKLRRLPEQTTTPISPGLLQPSARGQIQAEYHRPTELVHTLVQRHFFPAEGAVQEGVGEPVDEGASSTQADKRLSEYQRLVRRRAAETSKAMKMEQDAKLRLAQAARDRLQAAKDFGVRVAVGNAKVLLRGIDKVQVTAPPQALPGSGALSPSTAVDGQQQGMAEVQVPLLAPKQLSIPDQIKLEKEHYNKQPIVAQVTQEPMPEPRPHVVDAAPQPRSSDSRPAVQVLPASAAARQRLLSHSTVEAAVGGAGSQAQDGSPWRENRCANMASANHARNFKAKVLQPANGTAGMPVPKLLKGKPLPLAVSVSDEIGLARIAQKVSELGGKLVLPRLCSCPNIASLFDPSFVTKCARNCPLYMQPKRYESLLTALLRAKDVI